MKRSFYTDQEIINGLRDRNESVVKYFFYQEEVGLLKEIQYKLFKNRVDYDEMVSELYLYLQADNWRKLDTFAGLNGAHLCTWMSVVAWRFFMSIYDQIVEKDSEEDLLAYNHDCNESSLALEIGMDLERVFKAMKNERYVEVLKLLLIEGCSPEEVAALWKMKVDNVYNIKHRAIAKFIKIYGK